MLLSVLRTKLRGVIRGRWWGVGIWPAFEERKARSPVVHEFAALRRLSLCTWRVWSPGSEAVKNRFQPPSATPAASLTAQGRPYLGTAECRVLPEPPCQRPPAPQRPPRWRFHQIWGSNLPSLRRDTLHFPVQPIPLLNVVCQGAQSASRFALLSPRRWNLPSASLSLIKVWRPEPSPVE